MPQSLTKMYVHIVFSTKQRFPFLTEMHCRRRTCNYLAGICRKKSTVPLAINGMEDHVHILCNLGKQVCIADLVRDLKSNSSKWIHQEFSTLGNFQWQKGYGAFAVSESGLRQVKHYIQYQEDHHRKWSFQNEFRKLCKAYNLEIDERYVWE